jgi:hypothetical protein
MALGVAVSSYLKLVKAMAKFMILCLILSSPLVFIFFQGNVHDIDTDYFGAFSMGNVG